MRVTDSLTQRSGRESLQFVTFEIPLPSRSMAMSLNIQKVKEVVEISELSIVPSESSNIIGILDHRGCPIPVLDISKLVMKSETSLPDLSHYTRVIICELQNLWVGVPVAKTGRIISCQSADFLPPPPGGKIEGSRIITGLVKKNHNYIPILDLDSILESAGWTLMESSGVLQLRGKFSGKKVLIVEDSKSINKRLDRLFQQLGFETTLAFHGEQGLKCFLEDNKRFDLVFTDIEMPVLDGIEMVKQIRATLKGSRVPILFNSALSNPALISEIQKEDLGQYLVKFDEKVLLEQLEKIFFKNS